MDIQAYQQMMAALDLSKDEKLMILEKREKQCVCPQCPNYKECNPEEFTKRYRDMLCHYGLKGEKIQAGEAHENGDIEQRHHRFKRAVEQALLLRGSREFAIRQAYAVFTIRNAITAVFGYVTPEQKHTGEDVEILTVPH